MPGVVEEAAEVPDALGRVRLRVVRRVRRLAHHLHRAAWKGGVRLCSLRQSRSAIDRSPQTDQTYPTVSVWSLCHTYSRFRSSLERPQCPRLCVRLP